MGAVHDEAWNADLRSFHEIVVSIANEVTDAWDWKNEACHLMHAGERCIGDDAS